MEDKKVFDKKENVVNHINDNLKDYEGYVQFSHRAIDLEKDLFPRTEDIEDEKGFVFEAHFCKDGKSIMIRQLNHEWVVSSTDIANAEIEKYYGIADLEINMAQIWKPTADEYCEGMEVMKLQKVVFAGFTVNNKKGEES